MIFPNYTAVVAYLQNDIEPNQVIEVDRVEVDDEFLEDRYSASFREFSFPLEDTFFRQFEQGCEEAEVYSLRAGSRWLGYIFVPHSLKYAGFMFYAFLA